MKALRLCYSSRKLGHSDDPDWLGLNTAVGCYEFGLLYAAPGPGSCIFIMRAVLPSLHELGSRTHGPSGAWETAPPVIL